MTQAFAGQNHQAFIQQIKYLATQNLYRGIQISKRKFGDAPAPSNEFVHGTFGAQSPDLASFEQSDKILSFTFWHRDEPSAVSQSQIISGKPYYL
jgi:hypothetical protein